MLIATRSFDDAASDPFLLTLVLLHRERGDCDAAVALHCGVDLHDVPRLWERAKAERARRHHRH